MLDRQVVLDGAVRARDAFSNRYDAGGGYMPTVQQVADWVCVRGQDDFPVTQYSLDEWLSAPRQDEPQAMACDDPTKAREMLRLLRDDCLLRSCEAWKVWLFATDRLRVGER